MSQKYDPRRLDVGAFARDAGAMSADDLLDSYPRLATDAQGAGGGSRVNWNARGELRAVPGASDEVWLHLWGHAVLPMICQRCLESADIELTAKRSFRFVEDEEQAAALDEDCEDDVLALEREFNLHDLVEDELLLEMPLVPVHEVCPQQPRMRVADPAFESEPETKPHPFAQLASLQSGKSR